jgi:hypothetical protein
MIVFTVLGVLVYWWVMFWIGYYGAMAWDAHRGLTALTSPVISELEELTVAVQLMTRAAR